MPIKLSQMALTAIFAAAATAASSHYGMVIPSDNMVDQEDGRSVSLTLSFSHPFEGDGMVLDEPVSFGVTHEGETTDLLGLLQEAEVMGQPGFVLDYPLEAPGTHAFAMEPQPYWEPGEDSFIIHYTKTYVSAYGEDGGWDAELGLRTEIVPVSKPFALWTGNAFQGVVMLDGEPVPHSDVEIEYYNEDGAAVAPSELMITQTVKADENGVFTYVAPRGGWWGFAALNTAPETMEHEGEDKAVELGAVVWVHFEDWMQR
ncbi:Nickel uptake substrate-specific transmembrane region [Roseivivax jejudonensis]|uniref:Nickel uptake substrate-specific transmembrane region n=1 Tax=Roseivivax jejudonensis TaxID=1529041 RepID=A0A1X6Y7S5_9RHOB|nr:DUF4198 domain-containing protein [Roseivivax jejudonensis]SLN12893.1 Nickel uptake substrate-specific transmembrane region [Roseivivax jejudonensis]